MKNRERYNYYALNQIRQETIEFQKKITGKKEKQNPTSEFSKILIKWELLVAYYQVGILKCISNGIGIDEIIEKIKIRTDFDYQMSALVKAYHDLGNIGFLSGSKTKFIEEINNPKLEEYRKKML